MKKLLILLLIISNTSLAQDSIQLDKGQPAPFSGYLLPPEKVQELRNNDIDLSLSKKTNDLLNQEIVDYQKRLELYKTDNEQLSERITKSDASFFEKSGYFILGALITGIVSYGVYKSK